MAWNRRQVEAPRGTPSAALDLVLAEEPRVVEHLRAAARLAQLLEAHVNLLDCLGRLVAAARRAALVEEREELVDDDASRTRERGCKALCLVHGAGQGEHACCHVFALPNASDQCANAPQCATEATESHREPKKLGKSWAS